VLYPHAKTMYRNGEMRTEKHNINFFVYFLFFTLHFYYFVLIVYYVTLKIFMIVFSFTDDGHVSFYFSSDCGREPCLNF